MEAKELRIGNFVTLNDKVRRELWNEQINTQKEYFEVKTIYSDGDISLELDNEIVDIIETDVDAIPITKQVWYKIESEIIKAKFSYSHSELRNSLKIYLDNLEITCKHLHQLQNLYFALTNEELTINL